MSAVFVEYFRAPDRATAARAGWRGIAGSRLDGFRTGLMPEVELGMLLALAQDRPWTPDLVETEEVWPRRRFFRSWYEGPPIAELSGAFVRHFASIADSAVPGLVTRWAQTEAFALDSDVAAGDYTYLEQVAFDIIGLARRAQEAGDNLYMRLVV
jgi:hypothetical protein